eukprot:GHVQ01027300.1.p1 GENE.GHVQ01027300.1~~GHVQ01027300.1.p1  ORF type:complete len:127 (+),score=17.65 GHVQ01027300.1:231-611(+)
MKLLTHNLLMCNRKQCSGGFPLQIKLDACRENAMCTEEGDYNGDFILSVLDRIDWKALVDTSKTLGTELPPSYNDTDKQDEHFLRMVHHVLLEIHINEATLVCPKCQREYPVSKGIPNMLLSTDEV